MSGGTYCIRILTGPLERGVFPLGERLEIGRSSSSEVQLVTPGVSRSHAVVLREEGDGTFTLVDMLSTNGTLLGGEKVQRHALRPGDTFSIGESQLMFDELEPGEEPFNPLADRVVEESTRASTDKLDLNEIKAGLPPDGGSLSATPESELPGVAGYAGNLLADLVLYRNLRLKLNREGRLDEATGKTFRHLDQALRVPPSTTGRVDPRRAFARFPSDVRAKLAFGDSRSQSDPVHLLDVAVDGARITAPPRDCDADALCWLSVPVPLAAGLRTVVFTARVVWVRGDELGLVFFGAPGWANRSGAEEAARTQRVGKLRLEKMRIERRKRGQDDSGDGGS